jgi:lipopolysaccharide transport system permease protein
VTADETRKPPTESQERDVKVTADPETATSAAHADAGLAHHRIAPPTSWSDLSFAELWSFRDLFGILALRDIKLRYKQTAFGVGWVILQPLLSSLIFAAIFGSLAKLPSDGAPYILFVFAGMLPWNLFAGSLQRAGNSLVGDARLISKVYFPRIVIPIASATAVLLDFAVAFVVMGILTVGYGILPSWTWLATIPLVALTFAIAVGVSLVFSALSVYYRDFVYALPFIIQLWMFGSPLVYSTSLVPERWQFLYGLNPMSGVMDGFRWAILGHREFPATGLALSLLGATLLLLLGVYVFQRVERSFADVI